MLRLKCSRAFLLLWLFSGILLPTISAQAAVYKWVDADGVVHFSDQSDSKKAQLIEIAPTQSMPALEKIAPAATDSAPAEDAAPEQTAAPEAEKSPNKKAASLPTVSKNKLTKIKHAEMAEKQKINERICQLRYGLSCNELFHWKTNLRKMCAEKQTDACEQPQYFLRNRPPAILFRDFGKEFPGVDNSSKQELECLAKSGFYCFELNNDAYCKQSYDVKQCKELRNWVAIEQKRCREEDHEDCDTRILAYRPRTAEEMNKIRYGTDLAVEREEVKELAHSTSNQDKYLQKLWEIVNQYPGD